MIDTVGPQVNCGRFPIKRAAAQQQSTTHSAKYNLKDQQGVLRLMDHLSEGPP